MRHSDKPIRNIEDALRFLVTRKGVIQFRDAIPTIRGIVSSVSIIGEDDLKWQNDYAFSKGDIENSRFEILTEHIVRLAEQIRRKDSQPQVGFAAPEKP